MVRAKLKGGQVEGREARGRRRGEEEGRGGGAREGSKEAAGGGVLDQPALARVRVRAGDERRDEERAREGEASDRFVGARRARGTTATSVSPGARCGCALSRALRRRRHSFQPSCRPRKRSALVRAHLPRPSAERAVTFLARRNSIVASVGQASEAIPTSQPASLGRGAREAAPAASRPSARRAKPPAAAARPGTATAGAAACIQTSRRPLRRRRDKLVGTERLAR